MAEEPAFRGYFAGHVNHKRGRDLTQIAQWNMAELKGTEIQDEFAFLWRNYGRMAWMMAIRASERFGGQAEEYVGFMALQLLNYWRHFDKNRGVKFTTYYMSSVLRTVMQDMLRFESERHGLRLIEERRAKFAAKKNRKITYRSVSSIAENMNDGKYEWSLDKFLIFRDETREGLFDDFRNLFPTKKEFTDYMLRGLNGREKRIVEGVVLQGRTLRHLGIDFGITRERVRQILGKTLSKMKKRIGTLDKFDGLFKRPA